MTPRMFISLLDCAREFHGQSAPKTGSSKLKTKVRATAGFIDQIPGW